MTVEQELNNCLAGAEYRLQQAIRLSNDNFRTFWNISILARSLKDNINPSVLIAYQDWLQSFLVQLRDSVAHHRQIRNNISDLIEARNEYERSLREESNVLILRFN